MTGKPGFICATLLDQIERQASFAGSFGEPGQFRFVRSVDGRSWSEEEADTHISTELMEVRRRERERGKNWLNPAAVACALTHRDRLLAVAEQRPAILCEDDVLLDRDFVAAFTSQGVGWSAVQGLEGIVLFHYFSRDPITAYGPPVSSFGRYKIYRLDDVHVVSGACYHAPPKTAEAIRRFQTPLRVTADHWQAMRSNGVFPAIYAVDPSPCTIAGMASNIGYGGEWRSNSVLAVWLRRIKRLLQRSRNRFHETITLRT